MIADAWSQFPSLGELADRRGWSVEDLTHEALDPWVVLTFDAPVPGAGLALGV